MKDIKSILKSILSDLKKNSDSITVISNECILDNLSSVKFHLFDDYFYIEKGDEKVTESHFTRDYENPHTGVITTGDRSIIEEIKMFISDGRKIEIDKDSLMNGRAMFAGWYENPEPVNAKPEPVTEENTEEYIR